MGETMWRYVAKRGFLTIVILLTISAITFIAVSFAPGDPAEMILGFTWTPEGYELLRKQLGLDKPLYIQYLRWLTNALHGDLGTSYSTRTPVVSELARAIPLSLQLASISMVISTLISIPLGIYSAVKQYSILDAIIRFGTVLLGSMPTFWLGLLFILFFSVRLNLLPTSGYGGILYYIMPTTTLVLYSWTSTVRMTRACILEVLRKDYIRTARAKGLREFIVIYKHALRNAIGPIIAQLGVSFGALVGSSVVLEVVFNWPGLGRVGINAIQQRDIPLIQGFVLVIALIITLTNLIVDILQMLIDPRTHQT